jgi:Adenosine deaminase
VRQAVDVAGAERIGYGADVTYENDPDQLLKDMAAKHVLVEINLSSNEDVLGMVGENHPLPIYRKSGVPVTLVDRRRRHRAHRLDARICPRRRDLRSCLRRSHGDRAEQPRIRLPAWRETMGKPRLR